MSHQVALREEPDSLGGVPSLAAMGIFAEAAWKSYGRALTVEQNRDDVVENRADREAAADEFPSATCAEPSQVKIHGAVIGELDGKRADQRASGESKNAAQQPLGGPKIQAERRADHIG